MQKNLINSDLHIHSELQDNNKDSAEWKIANKKTLTSLIILVYSCTCTLLGSILSTCNIYFDNSTDLSFNACTPYQLIHNKQRSMRFVIFCKYNSFFLSVKIVLKPFFGLNVNLLQTKSIEHNSEILSNNE